MQNKNALFANLSILPASGSSFYTYDTASSQGATTSGWVRLYQHDFSSEEKKRILAAVTTATADMHFEKIYGAQIADRGSQITFSAVGQDAPIAVKKDWDPDHKIRESIVAFIRPALTDMTITIGGMTSIDITKKGIDKEYGINALISHFSIQKSDVVYVGDAIFPGGNDYAAVTAGVPTYQVKDVSETKNFIRGLLQGIIK